MVAANFCLFTLYTTGIMLMTYSYYNTTHSIVFVMGEIVSILSFICVTKKVKGSLNLILETMAVLSTGLVLAFSRTLVTQCHHIIFFTMVCGVMFRLALCVYNAH